MASENKIRVTFLRFLTFVFDVPITALIATLIIFNKINDKKSLIIFIVCFTLMPILGWIYFFRNKNYSKYRKLSFIINILSFPSGLVLLMLSRSNPILIAIALSYLITGVFLTAINAFGYKISGHAAGIVVPGISLGIIFGITGYIYLLLLIPAGYAKVKIKDHTAMQFVTGAICTVAITYVSFYITRMIW